MHTEAESRCTRMSRAVLVASALAVAVRSIALAQSVTLTIPDVCAQSGATTAVQISLTNDVNVRAVQFRITDVPDEIELVSASCTSRAPSNAGFSCSCNEVNASNRINCIILSLTGGLIAPGAGSVLEMTVRDRAPSCQANTSIVLRFSNIVVADENSQPVQGSASDGTLTCGCPVQESCFDIVDNDGDGLVDGGDTECPPASKCSLPQCSVFPLENGKTVAKCEKTITKAGAKFIAQRLDVLGKCTSAAFACVQQKPGVQQCRDKAAATCGKLIAGLEEPTKGGGAKLKASILKACGPKKAGEPPQVDPTHLFGEAGLGHGAQREQARCDLFDVATLLSIDGVVKCVVRQHACASEQIFSKGAPRAAEMLTFLGRDPGSDFPCISEHTSGGAEGLGSEDRAKAAVKCHRAIGKAGAQFVSGYMKNVSVCSAAVLSCLQTKPYDSSCLDKAKAQCAKVVDKITTPEKGVEAKLIATIVKACGMPALEVSDLRDVRGVGYQLESPHCAALGMPNLESASDVASCIMVNHKRRAEQLSEKESPRSEELFGFGDAEFPLPE